MPSPVSRRHALKLLAGLPMLPLAGTVSAQTLFAPPRVRFAGASFRGMPAPTLHDAAAMATTAVGSLLDVRLADDTILTYKLAYKPFFVTGDLVPDGSGGKVLAGGIRDIRNRPVIDRSVPGKPRPFFSDCPDGTSLLTLADAHVPGVRGKPVFAVVQFEYTTRDRAGKDAYGTLPSPVAVLTLDQDQATGALALVNYHHVDTASVHGLWTTCGASLSPWNTHLSSEEYEPDAPFAAADPTFRAFSRHLYGSETAANPYHYGHLPEITVHPDGTGSVKKHYCLGRISHELIQVMPDERTALMGDDYTNGGLFMFVADRPRDLSAGTLYVAKVGPGFSLDPQGPGAPLSWIRLGHAGSAEIERLADTLKPADILDASRTDPHDASYTRILLDGKPSWVRLKPGMELAAAFLETHRYANLVGASMAFTKLEGTTVNVRDKIAYSALQHLHQSMVRGHPAWREEMGVSLERAVEAGGILAHTLAGGQADTAGAPIASEWVPVRTRALLVGEDIAADALGNLANPDRIANPDNLKFSEKLRTLFIGEDSNTHVNSFLWAYNVDTGRLERLLSTPAGAESTGLHAVDEINGWTYIMSNFQHPGDWKQVHAKVRARLDPLVRANYRNRDGGAVGYLTGERSAIKLA
jgi:secreted PhoX family phosphatase